MKEEVGMAAAVKAVAGKVEVVRRWRRGRRR